MNQYRSAWLLLCRSVAVVGACLAVLIYPSASAVALWCTGAVVGCVLTYARRTAADVPAPKARTMRKAGMNALSAGVAVLAVAGFTVVLNGWVWALILVAVITSPWAIERLLRHTPSSPDADGHPAPREAEPADVPDIPVQAATFAPSVQALDDADICQAWRGSYRWLEVAPTLALQAYIVALRQAYLDELDRRDHDGLEAWLDSRPRPRGGPDKFLHHGTDGHHLSA